MGKNKKSDKEPGKGGKESKAAAAEPEAPAPPPEKCESCGGKLVDLEDYVFAQRLRRAAACIPTAVVLCIAWSVLYALIRVGVGGKLGAAGGGGLVALVASKILVGAILGVLLGFVAGVWRTDVGLFLGVVIGSLGGFFVAAAKVMPLQSDAAHRPDIVAAAVICGILAGATVHIAHARACSRSQKFIGPEPHEPSGAE